MRTLFLISIALIAISGGVGCARKHSAVQPGKTTQEELHKEVGQPLSTRQSALRRGSLIELYGDHVQYQVENGIVVAQIREPDPDELSLQSWLQRWKDIETRREPVPGTSDGHGRTDMQLVAPTHGMAVIFDPSNGAVKQVVRYGSP